MSPSLTIIMPVMTAMCINYLFLLY